MSSDEGKGIAYLEHALAEKFFVILPELFKNNFAELGEINVTISNDVILENVENTLYSIRSFIH